ncbi:beta-ketoacyl synthase [Nocardia sp. BMG51109]|uniref:beta-ketoacyl-[acyl-carrier-protein] synthase family protein n=1 Tax=Nocardia sp. BMG51109 TaxID=1056816 RepID=UPI000465CBA0|nr:beta-ketoacyl-[acyl-carrier-protein] synthase family protein [Nocardia sp. BMG51109]
MTAPRRAVITGIGIVTALGTGVADNWSAIVAGRTAIGHFRLFDPTPLRTHLGAEILDFVPSRYLGSRARKMSTRGDQLAVAAALLALDDAGLGQAELGHRAGLFLGGNKDICHRDETIAELGRIRKPDGTVDLRALGENAATLIPPLAYVEGLQNGAVFHVSSKFGIRGANCFYAGTADAGATAIGRAMRAVRHGVVDLSLAGGFDDATTWWAMSRMDGLGVLTHRNELGERAFRPFDRDHSGSVLGEGAVVLVIEERDRAHQRAARCYAEITGFGAGNDGRRPPAPDPRGRGLSRAIRYAAADAGELSNAIDYIAAHGCATPAGDVSETRALHAALGPAARDAQISSVKPQTGHLVGGAGALNVAVAAMALHSGIVPATRNLRTPARGCDLDFVPGAARQSRPNGALALARGLEGQAVAVALNKMG